MAKAALSLLQSPDLWVSPPGICHIHIQHLILISIRVIQFLDKYLCAVVYHLSGLNPGCLLHGHASGKPFDIALGGL